tara:strand:+ start:32562 stop:33257 length:696 start_codon:yes stop_codon:yes gene_type:complete
MFFNLNPFRSQAPCTLCARSGGGLCTLCRAHLQASLTLEKPLCRCGLPTPGVAAASLCGRCLRRPPPFSATYSQWRYDFPVDRLINAYKHRGRLHLERALLSLAEPAPGPWPEADLVCPLPAHWRRRLWRGFDQAERFARHLGQSWRQPVVPLLRRRHASQHQQGLSQTQRQRNLRDAFIADPRAHGQRVLLIDDVMTSGGSARAASHALLNAGAREVRVWVLARTLQGRG